MRQCIIPPYKNKYNNAAPYLITKNIVGKPRMNAYMNGDENDGLYEN